MSPNAPRASLPGLKTETIAAIALLAAGMAAAGLGYGVFGPPNEAGVVNPPIWPPRWLFWAIWMVLYPTAGVAGAWLWAGRLLGRDSWTAWRLYLCSVTFSLSWVPVVQASGSKLVMPVIMDLIGGVVGVAALVAAARVNRRAMIWLAPINIWGVVTTVLKVWRLALNS